MEIAVMNLSTLQFHACGTLLDEIAKPERTSMDSVRYGLPRPLTVQPQFSS
jgi:hypothetical protein